MDNEQLKRIADAIEEILRLVKKDQQETRARFEERWDKEDKEAAQWAAVPDYRWPRFILATGAGSWPKDQATSVRRQAASVKQQAWQDNIIRI